ncbi:MAG TPA: hypothetical protein VFH54_01940 [Mycobacteriales bacterium]|nr:hypothetical protein [Mycobacteriales bacterium]
MTEEAPHGIPAPMTGRGADPAARGGTVGAGLEPEESVEGKAEAAAHAAGPQPDEGLVEPGGVDTEKTR